MGDNEGLGDFDRLMEKGWGDFRLKRGYLGYETGENGKARMKTDERQGWGDFRLMKGGGVIIDKWNVVGWFYTDGKAWGDFRLMKGVGWF